MAIKIAPQLTKLLYCPKNLMYGNGMAQTNPSKLKTMSGTHIQWIALLVGF